ncbi:TonB C-terminal domain-containing protein [Trichloromonas sp.]|uniref:TonB C-terminal domain-containing protein n=1 Tax=Trichloromonas sp. TaxID=3069249 RepID=UPI003D81B4FE
MHPKQHTRQDIKARPEPGLGRMIAVSFVVHLAILGLMTGVLIPRMSKPPKPVYIVDLVNRPVKDPQAGRPDARPQPDKKDKKPESAATKPEPKPDAVKLPPKPEPKPKVEPKPTPKAEPKPEPKPAAKPTPKAEAKPTVSKKDEQKVSSAIEDLRRRQEMQALKDKLAAMGSNDTRNAAGNAPVGMIDGKGTEAGVSSDAWLHEFLKQAWRLSKYQVGRTDLAAEVQLLFDAKGQLLSYKFIDKSGDSHFDDSVLRAILQLKDYPEPTLAGAKKDVVFNLKELLK